MDGLMKRLLGLTERLERAVESHLYGDDAEDFRAWEEELIDA